MTVTPSKAHLVERAGGALYGRDWQSPVAKLLDINLRTIQRIAEAAREGRDYPVPPGVLRSLGSALETRGAQLREVRRDIIAALQASD